jgi:hypothetical protein
MVKNSSISWAQQSWNFLPSSNLTMETDCFENFVFLENQNNGQRSK